MLRLRPYKKCDADKIVSWLNDERTFQLWGGDHFGSFPITADVINHKYYDQNGDCTEEDNFYPVTAFDDEGPVGHFIMRYIGGNKRIVRFGWVIVDNEKRGHQYGRKMLALGLKYAFEIMGAEQVTLGVYETNIRAHRCYSSLGFRDNPDAKHGFVMIQGEKNNVVELRITKEEYEDSDLRR